METIIKHLPSKVSIDCSDITDFSSALIYLAKYYVQAGSPQVFLSSQSQDGEKISNFLPFHRISLDESQYDYDLYLKTSGSSGRPKLVQKTFLQMCEEGKFLANFIEHILEKSSIQHILCTVQPQHLFGLSFAVFMPWFLSSMPKVQNTEPFIENVMAYTRDVLIASPTLLGNIAQMDEVSENFQNLKLIISAGSPLGDEVRSSLRTQAVILDVYGSTETGAIGYNIGDGLKKFAPVCLENTDDETLCVSSPWCEKIQIADRARLNNDQIILLGRSDDIVKINDKRFSLYEIQGEIRKNPFVADCIVYPKENRLAVVLQLSAKGLEFFRDNGKQGLVERIRVKLDFKDKSYLRFFKIVSHIPRNAQGKISKDQKEQVICSLEEIALSVVSKEGGAITLEGEIPQGCFYFDGHFIDFPLVPGFVELGLVMEYSKFLDIDFLEITKISNVKFTNFLRPGDFCRLCLEKTQTTLSFKMYSNQEICLSGRAVLGDKNA